MIHCYVPANEDIEAVKEHAQKQLKKFARHRPILLIFVQDDSEHNMSKALVDLDILSRLTTDEKARFGQLIASHEQKQRRVWMILCAKRLWRGITLLHLKIYNQIAWR